MSLCMYIFLNPFTICSAYKRKFVGCPFVYEETNRSHPFANVLNGLNGLAHLCLIWIFGTLGRNICRPCRER